MHQRDENTRLTNEKSERREKERGVLAGVNIAPALRERAEVTGSRSTGYRTNGASNRSGRDFNSEAKTFVND